MKRSIALPFLLAASLFAFVSMAQTPPGGNPPDSLANQATQCCLKERSKNDLKDMLPGAV